MIKKDFKKGDIVVVTSGRNALACDIATGLWTTTYERDLTKEEAIEIHYKNMLRDYPGLKITKKEVEEILNEYDKFFLTESGESLTYDNHEKADIFDLRYLNGENLSDLIKLKDEFIRKNNIKPDEDGHFRCWE